MRHYFVSLIALSAVATAVMLPRPAAAHWRVASHVRVVRCPCYFPAWAWGDYPMRSFGVACVWHHEPNGWWRDCI